MEGVFHLRAYRTRNIGTSSQFDYTTTGTRTFLSVTWVYTSLIGSVSDRDMLMEECVRVMQQTLRAAPSIKKRAKSVYSQRNLGTIKDRKREKKEEKEVGGGKTIMRILRMRYVFSTLPSTVSRSVPTLMPPRPRPSRPNTSEFIAQQLQILATMQAEQEQRERQQQMRRAQRPGGIARIPEVPAVPEIPP
jgi:hypothetical protein